MRITQIAALVHVYYYTGVCDGWVVGIQVYGSRVSGGWTRH